MIIPMEVLKIKEKCYPFMESSSSPYSHLEHQSIFGLDILGNIDFITTLPLSNLTLWGIGGLSLQNPLRSSNQLQSSQLPIFIIISLLCRLQHHRRTYHLIFHLTYHRIYHLSCRRTYLLCRRLSCRLSCHLSYHHLYRKARCRL